jgi:hypothetical protein
VGAIVGGKINCCKQMHSTQMFLASTLCLIGSDIVQLLSFIHNFYVFKLFFLYSHCNQKGQLSIIPLAITMGTHRGDPFRKPLFVLVHLQAFHSIKTQFLSCLFFTIANDNHIKDFLSMFIAFEFLIL